MLELLPEVIKVIIMDNKQEDTGLDAKEIANLSKDDALQRMRKIEHQIGTLEWDSRMNQIHPFRLYQLKKLKAARNIIKEHCEALAAE